MDSDVTFFEIIAQIPRRHRSDSAHALAALWKLRESGTPCPATRDVAAFLRQHLGRKSPTNVSDVLSKLPPFAERVREQDSGLRWRITGSGLRRLQNLSGLVLEKSRSCAISLTALHPRILAAAQDLFLNKHYPEAIGRAAKELNRMVRDRAGRVRDDGVAMMHQIFSDTEGNADRLVVGSLDEDWQRDRQYGLKFMMAGCQAGIANVDKHGELLVQSELEALECLAVVSHLARQVDRTIRISPRQAIKFEAPIVSPQRVAAAP
jgi:uncharacterized protein (TIGR02391 family)